MGRAEECITVWSSDYRNFLDSLNSWRLTSGRLQGTRYNAVPKVGAPLIHPPSFTYWGLVGNKGVP